MKDCTRVYRIRKKDIRDKPNVFNINERKKGNKGNRKERVERMNDERLPKHATKYKAKKEEIQDDQTRNGEILESNRHAAP